MYRTDFLLFDYSVEKYLHLENVGEEVATRNFQEKFMAVEKVWNFTNELRYCFENISNFREFHEEVLSGSFPSPQDPSD